MSQSTIVDESLTIRKSPAVNSRINPCLIRFCYFLGNYLVLPAFFSKITVKGQENIPLTGGVILAPTHRSRWDALILPYAVGRLVSRRDLRFMVSANEMKGVQGWLIRRLGGFPVNTDHPGMGSLVHSVELLAAGEMVAIFPEGGICRDRVVHPLKPGVARIALEVKIMKPDADIKILPVSISYNQPYPGWGSEATVNIGQGINVLDYQQNSLKRETVRLTKTLSDRLKLLHEDRSP
ncbi:1-acyl-sn-glycerol-3-phosphate acyltransferase [Microcystis flos-aquae FACHB-1344]|uniref:1-acyl-sn-glycerol-3-phosphate acyltransferase n=1 Tax=Microcystis flos-aquae FACHB-1344 TaxID=2692899 RepID=A0ABR8HQY4_9CHRO|nr:MULTISPECIES: 1-acyl-sn-glycerol-3-phosphate acyltransferase [Microcystis]MBD2621888.1 1-acyl-sn-glycerol-3-phosphate acyltransferase [Microcystis flos-aquae FACHB-1344]MCA2703035.1 1-acyl-sn-glycerol-3-phosphate acyltransferase [Microcystis sp. M179S2]